MTMHDRLIRFDQNKMIHPVMKDQDIYGSGLLVLKAV